MKNKNLLLLFSFVLVLFILSCTQENETDIFWINSIKSECSSGAGKMPCLSIYRGNDLNNPKWETFYANIDSFSFELGYYQQIEVIVERLENVPADASSIKYTLVKTIEKKRDSRMRLNDIWICTRIDNHPLNRMIKSPQMEINLSKMNVMGNDGCNDYLGSIKTMTSSLLAFGPIVSAQKMCLDPSVSETYNKALLNTASYFWRKKELILLNKNNVEILSFLKTD